MANTGFLSAFHIAFRSVRRAPLRGLLTTLGITIGVAAVVAVTSLARGARAQVSAQIDGLGTNAMIIFPRSARSSGAQDGRSKLRENDVDALLREGTSIRSAAPQLQSGGQIIYEDQNANSAFVGTRTAFFEIRSWEVSDGDIWNANQELLGERVVLLGAQTKADLFGTQPAVGRSVRIGRHLYTVLGVLEEKGQTALGNQDQTVVMPITTLRSRILSGRPGDVHAILLSSTAENTTDRAMRQAESILRHRHHIEEEGEDDFVIRSQAQFRQMQESILGALSMLLISIAAVSLVVGGIGVMNIMLVSVTERTREIGIRIAIGARSRDIMWQFLWESVLLTIAGGLVGTGLGWILVRGLSYGFGWEMSVGVDALAIALTVSAVVGISFGFFPARGASRLDPVKALSRE